MRTVLNIALQRRSVEPSDTGMCPLHAEGANIHAPNKRKFDYVSISRYIYRDRKTAKIDELTAKIGAAIERLQEYRSALITAAVTGKIDVREKAVL